MVARSLKVIGLGAVIMNEQLCHRACVGHSRAPCQTGWCGLHGALSFSSNRCCLRSVAIPTMQCAEPCLVSVSPCQISCSAQLSIFESQPRVSRRHVHARPSFILQLLFSQEVNLLLLALRSLEFCDAARGRRSLNWISPAGHCGQQKSPPPC